MSENIIEVPMDPSRVCDAIARIGYTPASAIMDIVDNSVTWGAKKVRIIIKLQQDKNYNEKNNIASVTVVDDAGGMDNNGILNALKLGSPANYVANSLSKYGMGLKSAGFSLGQRITILSKKENVSNQHHVDKKEIAAKGKYVVTVKSPEPDISELLTQTIDTTGTVVKISGCESTNHDSAKRTIEQLQHELGVTYFGFISNPDKPLKITVECEGKPTVEVKPKDILFLSDAYSSFDKDQYDCKKPCKVFEGVIPLDENSNGNDPKLTVVLFPLAKVAGSPKLNEDERKRIKEYEVSRKNKGFFIYRNGRLIRWGDDLEGLVGKDDILIRARLSIQTQHDDLLHVDVSKQRLFIPEEIRDRIERLIQLPLRGCDEIAKLCNELTASEPGQEFNSKNSDLTIEEDEPVNGEQEKAEARRRRKAVAEKTKSDLESAGETLTPVPPGEIVTEIPPFQKVRYSDKVSSVVLWEMGQDPTDGVFVRINKNHMFYQTVLSVMQENAPERQAIEAIIWCCAVGESQALTNLTKIDSDLISAVLAKFKKSHGVNLDTWASSNQDLFSSE